MNASLRVCMNTWHPHSIVLYPSRMRIQTHTYPHIPSRTKTEHQQSPPHNHACTFNIHVHIMCIYARTHTGPCVLTVMFIRVSIGFPVEETGLTAQDWQRSRPGWNDAYGEYVQDGSLHLTQVRVWWPQLLRVYVWI